MQEWPSLLWSKAFRPGSTAGLIVVAGLVGAGVGAMTVVLVLGIDAVAQGARWMAGRLPTEWPWMFVAVPAGLLTAWWIARRFAPEVAGDGVPEVIADLTVRGGYVRTRVTWLKTLATSLTLGAGGSAGREGPIVQIGSSVGATFGRWAGLGEDQIRSLVAAGAGAGIGASFNAPIAGMLFAMEVILGGFAIRHLNTVVVASVVAAVVSRTLIGEELTFPVVKYPFGEDPEELLVYAALGLLAVGAGWLFLRTLSWFEALSGRLRSVPGWVLPVALGLVVAGLGMASVYLSEDFSFLEPPVLGTGQDLVSVVLRGGTFAWWVFAGLLLLKVVATSATLGARASAGAFAPSLYIGAVLGAGFAALLGPLWTASELQTGAFALVGSAAVFASVARAPLTAILIVFELTQDYGLVLPLMLATTLATLLTDLFHRESVYTMGLRRLGVKLPRRSEVDLLDTVHVRDVYSSVPVVLDPAMPLAKAREHMDRSRHHGLPVVENGRLVGIISITDIVRAGDSHHVWVHEAMTPGPATVTPSTPVSHALERMAALAVGRLPVVDEHESTLLLGMFRREDAVRAYHLALDAETQAQRARDRLRLRTHPETTFFEFVVPTHSRADGKQLSEIAWPEGLTVVSIRRDREVLVPTGATVIRSGDVLTAFGNEVAQNQVGARLAPEPEVGPAAVG